MFKRGGIFKDDFVTNLLPSLPVKTVCKSVNIWWSYGQEFGVLFFWLTIYTCILMSFPKQHQSIGVDSGEDGGDLGDRFW